ncbi:hypothetical protein [Leptospira meyeri]|uniref:hypothetical protein n=1 Tax=Leptospira meyeri TaxID=29508 RepID=UPI000C299AC2|nr:hypothetical protein [Leptospira meyeri]PKA23319.1 hypothetical protein CH381_26395 [Leptospira sp. mixed culture ATI2-C-A1]MCW7488797.1 hypothetical protein [Leptospira meyeri]PJZ81050.1 hypothetical protein CH359_08150 [Leptospira meyeri]PJZ96553.1 hypothetical protein CH358_09820 [Leptospira meyeri]PKA12900.1 hypothetical protein CH372_06615 [Leptospira meyeri]
MSHNKIILILGVVFFSFGSLLAKDFDSTHELPEVRQPDKHRVYFRSMGSAGGLLIPEKDYVRNEDLSFMLFNGATLNGLLNYSQQMPKFDGSANTRELEYRYQDKFRIFYESRVLVNQKKSQEADPYLANFTENKKSLGIAYYHPLSPYFNIGASLRQVTVDQSTNSMLLSYGFYQSGFFTNTFYVFQPRDTNLKVKGIVPGIHLEIKPLRWFEIHLGQQFYSLSGNDSRITTSVSTLGTAALGYSGGDASYTGTKQTIDFVFRFSSWFAAKWGYSKESMKVKYQNYLTLGNSPTATLLYSAWDGSQTSKFDFTSLNFTLEFSKSFGE